MNNQVDLLVIIPIAGFGAFLWLSLYIVSRASSQTPLTILSFLATLLQAGYFGMYVLVNLADEKGLGIGLSRGSWWANCLPIALWFHIATLVVRRGRSGPQITPYVAIAYGLGLVITLVGTFSDLFLNYSGAYMQTPTHVYVDSGPLYEVYIVYLALASGGAFFTLARYCWQISSGREVATPAIFLQVIFLLVGAGLFMGGGLYLALKFKYFSGMPDYPAFVAILLGLGLFGYAIAQYGMLVEGKLGKRDFAYSFCALLLMNLFYCVALILVGVKSPLTILVLVGLVNLTHTLYDWGRSLLDRVFFSRNEQAARQAARDYATALASQPVATPELQAVTSSEPAPLPATPDELPGLTSDDKASVKAFNDTVRRAITSLKNPPQLIKSPLLSLKMVEKRLQQEGEEDNRLGRAAALKSLLTEMIEQLRPADGATYGTTEAWRSYNVLYFPYVREISKKQAYAEAHRMAEQRRRNGIREPGELELALEWLSDIDEDTFYKWQRRASDTLATILREEETRLQGNRPNLPAEKPIIANPD